MQMYGMLVHLDLSRLCLKVKVVGWSQDEELLFSAKDACYKAR